MGNVKQRQSFKVVLYYDKAGWLKMSLSWLIIEFRLPPKEGMTLVRDFSNWEQFPESDGSWRLLASSTPSSQWNWSFTSEGVGVHLADYSTVNLPLVIVHKFPTGPLVSVPDRKGKVMLEKQVISKSQWLTKMQCSVQS